MQTLLIFSHDASSLSPRSLIVAVLFTQQSQMGGKKYSNRELMEMAIDVSRSSVPEHSDKTDPLVGAIITTSDGEILSTANRGELREGEHCEFTLIERKLKDVNLKGCVLYVTLEPCTDASRKPPKKGCSTHIVKSRISDVYIGALDPNPSIAGTGQEYLESKGVNVHRFPSDLESKIISLNSDFFKEKEEEAMLAATVSVKHSAKQSISEEYIHGRSLSDISGERMDEFLKRSGAAFRFGEDDFCKWALDFGILMEHKKGYLVTDLGLRLFGKNPEMLFPNIVFKTEIKHDNGDVDIRDFDGNLINQFNSIKEYIRFALKKRMDKSTGVRTETYEFPAEVIDETVANALIHRDYSGMGMTNYLYMDREKILIRSPGTIFRPLSINDLNEFQAPSNSRNQKIMFIFNKMGLAEQRGIGLRKMMNLPSKNFRRPVFKENFGCLEVTFDRTPIIVKKEYLDILNLMDRSGGVISTSEVSEKNGIPLRSAERYLSEMTKYNIVEKFGSGKNTRYVRRPIV